MAQLFDFYSRFEHVKRVTKNRYLKCIFIHAPHYTDHGETHCKNLEKHLRNFISANRHVKLNEYESFLLKCGIWLHDIGMVHRARREEKIKEIREKHHVRSRTIINNNRKIFDLSEFEANIVGTISFLHRRHESIAKEIRRHTPGGRGIKKTCYHDNRGQPVDFHVNIEKLAILLRLLDSCDREFTRSQDTDTLLKEAKLPEAAMYHWAHERVNNVCFSRNLIRLHTLVPPPKRRESSSKEENIINQLVINDMKKEIDSLYGALQNHGLGSLKVVQDPDRTGKKQIPKEIHEKYITHISSLKYKSIVGIAYESFEKNICINTTGHAVIEFVGSILVTGKQGIKTIPIMFGADDSSPRDFRFINFDAMRKKSISNRFDDFTFSVEILEHTLKKPVHLNVREMESLDDPEKYKDILLIFSRTLRKGTRLKYGWGYSAPNFFKTNDTKQVIRSSHYSRKDTEKLSISIKFEKPLKVKDMKLYTLDVDNNELFSKDLNPKNKSIVPSRFINTNEGKVLYRRNNLLYYDVHKIEIEHPTQNRQFSIRWRFGGV